MKKKSFTQSVEALLFDVGSSLTFQCKSGKECVSKKQMAYYASRMNPESPGKLTTSVDYVEKTVVVKSIPR